MTTCVTTSSFTWLKLVIQRYYRDVYLARRNCFLALYVRDKRLGTQFHPEKSGPDGLSLVSAFVKQLSRVVVP